ncbi:MAG: hypothetical protein HYX92_16340 [Chloroflexi bacterium]|nr:hypothetical protein [Chloroflexota bacterium]
MSTDCRAPQKGVVDAPAGDRHRKGCAPTLKAEVLDVASANSSEAFVAGLVKTRKKGKQLAFETEWTED